MYAGSNAAESSGEWTVAVGDWSTTDMWEWNNAEGYKGGAYREPGRPLEFEIFEQIVNSDADTFTIEMDKVYTFSTPEDIRAQLAERFPESCYLKPTQPPVATLEERYKRRGEELHRDRESDLRWRDGSHWKDGVSHELPDLPLAAEALVSKSMTCIQAEALESAVFPEDMANRGTWHIKPNSDQVGAEWRLRHARAVWGDHPRARMWLNREDFTDWCGNQMRPGRNR